MRKRRQDKYHRTASPLAKDQRAPDIAFYRLFTDGHVGDVQNLQRSTFFLRPEITQERRSRLYGARPTIVRRSSPYHVRPRGRAARAAVYAPGAHHSPLQVLLRCFASPACRPSPARFPAPVWRERTAREAVQAQAIGIRVQDSRLVRKSDLESSTHNGTIRHFLATPSQKW